MLRADTADKYECDAAISAHQSVEGAYYAAGTISYSQFVQMSLATQMYAQTQIRAARDTLVNTGDVGPA